MKKHAKTIGIIIGILGISYLLYHFVIRGILDKKAIKTILGSWDEDKPDDKKNITDAIEKMTPGDVHILAGILKRAKLNKVTDKDKEDRVKISMDYDIWARLLTPAT